MLYSALHYCRKVLKQITVAELQPDETVDAVREARLLAKVCGCGYCGCGHVSLVGVVFYRSSRDGSWIIHT